MADGGMLNGKFSNFLVSAMVGLLLLAVGGVWGVFAQLADVKAEVAAVKATTKSIDTRLTNVEQIVIYRGPEFNGGR